MALRWRGAGTRRHVSWDEAFAYFTKQPSNVRNWYEQANSQAQGLNAKHLELRKLTRGIRQTTQRREPHLFAKPIPSRRSVSTA